MAWVAGADGCKAGWVRVARDAASGALRCAVIADARGLLETEPRPEVLAIDIPIGLPDSGPRACDAEARARLGWPRRNSVFPAPIRAALQARSREEACRLTEPRDGRRVGAQAFAIYPKIREVDAFLTASGVARQCVHEVHPELCFWAMNGGQPLIAGKKSLEGRRRRLQLVEAWLGPAAFEAARRDHRRAAVADDDLLDAFAALWTATRIARGEARSLPPDPPRDAAGLPMRIVY